MVRGFWLGLKGREKIIRLAAGPVGWGDFGYLARETYELFGYDIVLKMSRGRRKGGLGI
jgi:hypothetical protein